MSEPRYEMLWDCPRCDTKKLLGLTHRFCPNCGAPQDPTKRYYPLDADKVAVGDHPFVGVDKVCPACEAPNAAVATHCTTCGRALDDAKEAKRQADLTGAPVGKPTPKAAPLVEAPPPKRSILPMLGCVALAGAGALVVGVILVFFLWKQDAGVTVTGHSWARTIEVQELRMVTDVAWQDQLPAGARVLSCQKEERGSKQIADGQDCTTRRVDNGDGTFSEKQDCTAKTKSEPTYAERCRYEVDKWVTLQTVDAKGSSLADKPRWPTPTLKPGTQLGAQREGPKAETYTLQLKGDDGKSGTCTLSEAKWAAAADGSSWSVPVGVLSGDYDCEGMKAR